MDIGVKLFHARFEYQYFIHNEGLRDIIWEGGKGSSCRLFFGWVGFFGCCQAGRVKGLGLFHTQMILVGFSFSTSKSPTHPISELDDPKKHAHSAFESIWELVHI